MSDYLPNIQFYVIFVRTLFQFSALPMVLKVKYLTFMKSNSLKLFSFKKSLSNFHKSFYVNNFIPNFRNKI